jgi:hypothetical protein
VISNSIVTPYDWPIKTEYKTNEPFTAIDMLTRPVYSMTITPEGWLNFARFDGQQCLLRPIAEGFDSGVVVSCSDFASLSIKVDDDIDAGEVRESIDGKTIEVFHYDPDTGALL